MKSIASHNGLEATRRAWQHLDDGSKPLDACVAGVTLVENDPDALTVGYGGLPNEDGHVELDAAVMDGLTHRGAAVAALRGVRHAAQVARCLLQQTDRAMLAGEGARQFARANGFKEEDLLTEGARRMWLHWKRTRSERDDWLPPEGSDVELDIATYFEKHFYKEGTVHVAALDAAGNLACCTSTSGHPFKLPGRVGDSPILGAGLYVDNEVGSCGSIGCGEAVMRNLSSFLAVELMREGRSPVEAGLEALRRLVAKTPPEQCDDQQRPTFNVQLYLLRRDGAHAGTAIWDRKQIAVTDSTGTRLEDCAALYERAPK